MLTKKSDYALRTLVYLAINEGKVISTREISKKLNIPYKFLTQITLELSRRNIIQAKRGSRGGVILKKKPSSLNVLEIVEAVDGPFYLHQCPADLNEPCFFHSSCAIKARLEEIEKSARDVLQDLTVDKIMIDYLEKKEAEK